MFLILFVLGYLCLARIDSNDSVLLKCVIVRALILFINFSGWLTGWLCVVVD